MAGCEQDEALLWRRACDGDAQAFAAVFDLHRNRVYGQAVRLLDTRSDAEDVTASTFLELWRRRTAVRLVNGSVLPWLLVTTANLARNAARARRRYRDFLARLPHEPDASDAADVALAGADVGVDPRLRQALRSLPEQDMALLVLVAYEDCAVADAAVLLGMTPAAAKTRLHRARHRLREQLPDFPRPSTGPEPCDDRADGRPLRERAARRADRARGGGHRAAPPDRSAGGRRRRRAGARRRRRRCRSCRVATLARR